MTYVEQAEGRYAKGAPNMNQPTGRRVGAAASPVVRRAKADLLAEALVPALREAWKAGHVSYRVLARHLNAHGFLAPRGGQWTAMQIKRLIDQLGASE